MMGSAGTGDRKGGQGSVGKASALGGRCGEGHAASLRIWGNQIILTATII